MDIPRCAACDELIFANEFTGAEEKVWHLRHFCCWECDKPLAGHKYVPDENGQPHCLYCYQQSHGKVFERMKVNKLNYGSSSKKSSCLYAFYSDIL